MVSLPIFIAHIQASRCCLGPHEKQAKNYPENPKTLGEHLRKRRLDLYQTQEQVAMRFGVSVTTYIYWEANHVVPKVDKWPKIVQFLGYDPSPPPTTFGDAVTTLRYSLGLDRHRFARRLGTNAKSVMHWESNRRRPCNRLLAKLANLRPDLSAFTSSLLPPFSTLPASAPNALQTG